MLPVEKIRRLIELSQETPTELSEFLGFVKYGLAKYAAGAYPDKESSAIIEKAYDVLIAHKEE